MRSSEITSFPAVSWNLFHFSICTKFQNNQNNTFQLAHWLRRFGINQPKKTQMFPANKPRNLTYQKCPAIVVEHVCKAKLLDDDHHHHLNFFSACQLWVYGCFLKWWYPQIINFNRVFHYKPSILGYPYLWKHPYRHRGIYGFIPSPISQYVSGI